MEIMNRMVFYTSKRKLCEQLRNCNEICKTTEILQKHVLSE